MMPCVGEAGPRLRNGNGAEVPRKVGILPSQLWIARHWMIAGSNDLAISVLAFACASAFKMIACASPRACSTRAAAACASTTCCCALTRFCCSSYSACKACCCATCFRSIACEKSGEKLKLVMLMASTYTS